jgi:vacuole morphology and inheritance protein 14
LLTNPVIKSFSDEDAKVRYTACETMFNILKICREAILAHLNEIFEGLIRVIIKRENQSLAHYRCE